MNPTRFLPALAAASFLAAVASAQSFSTVPLHADVVDGQQSLGLPFGAPGFRSQILVGGSAIAPTGAIIDALRFRADRNSLPMTATTVDNVTITLSQCTTAVGTMSQTFAQNITSTGTVVFQGTVTLPAGTATYAGAAPWDIVITLTTPFVYDVNQGNLLIDIVGNNAPGQFPTYFLDAVQGGGSGNSFGQSGPSGDNLNHIVGAAAPQLVIGQTVDFITTLTFSTPPALQALGFTGLPAPIDLAGLGAPSNSLYIVPEVFLPLAWNPSFIGYYATTPLPVPLDPTLINAVVYGQSLFLDPTANPLGIVTSNATEVRIGDPNEAFPMQQVDINDPAATFGNIVDFGTFTWGAVPVQFEGTFF